MKKLILCILVLFLLVAGCTQPAWTIYRDKSDGFKISHPADWSLTVTKTPPMNVVDLSAPYLTMENVVHIYSPDTNAAVNIMGFAYPPSLYSDDGISDESYNLIANVLSSPENGLKPISVTRDESSYVLNENSARRLEATMILDGKEALTDNYIIRHDKVYYILTYVMYDTSAEQHSATALEIIKTFKTAEWSV